MTSFILTLVFSILFYNKVKFSPANGNLWTNFNKNISVRQPNNLYFNLYITEPQGQWISIKGNNGFCVQIVCEQTGMYMKIPEIEFITEDICKNKNYIINFNVTFSSNRVTMFINQTLQTNITQNVEETELEIVLGKPTTKMCNTYPEKNSVKGCLDSSLLNEKELKFNTSSSSDIIHCSKQRCTSDYCYSGKCKDKYISDPYCDCTLATGKGERCNDELDDFKAPREFEIKSEATLFEILFKSYTEKNYCLLNMATELYEMNIVVNKNGTININMKNEAPKYNNSIAIKYQTNVTCFIIIDFKSKAIKVSNGNLSTYNLTKSFFIYNLVVIKVGHFNYSNCTEFKGKLTVAYNKSENIREKKNDGVTAAYNKLEIIREKKNDVLIITGSFLAAIVLISIILLIVVYRNLKKKVILRPNVPNVSMNQYPEDDHVYGKVVIESLYETISEEDLYFTIQT